MAGVSKDDDEISGINVTPLVDVVLVLLVIFMITAPALYQNTLSVQLPKTSTGEGQAAKGNLEIYIDQKGSIHVDGKRLALEDFRKEITVRKPASAVILADKKAEHGNVIEVVDSLKAQGVQKFSFGVEKAAN